MGNYRLCKCDFIVCIPCPFQNPNWMKAADKLPKAKQQITHRIDTEVLAFFKHTGKRYQSRMNAVLRSYVKAQKAQPTKSKIID